MSRALRIAVLAACFTAAACSRQPAPKTGDVAARVNGGAISVHQVNGLLAQDAAKVDSAQAALERIIDQEVLVQRAVADGVDRDPAVQAHLERARRQVLAQAWIDRAMQPVRATAEDVQAFYDANPALFAERRVYTLRQLRVAGAREHVAALERETRGAREIAQVERWLQARGVAFRSEASTQPAEALPLAMLPTLAAMREGEIAVATAVHGALVVQLVAATQAPLSAREATPAITQYLDGRRRAELSAREVKRLRAEATIEYVGEFDPSRDARAAGLAVPATPLRKAAFSTVTPGTAAH